MGCNCGGRIEAIDVSIDVAPRTLDFGLQSPGGVARQQITLTAHGAAVKVDRLLVREDARGSFSVGIAPITLSPEEPVSVEVLYAPRTEGADSAMLAVTFLDAFDELLVPLVGRAQTAALVDAGATDSGAPDAGERDAGEPDAGQPDAGQPDAGQPDAGEPFDAGVFDAGPPPDYGLPVCPVATTTRDVSTAITALPNTTWVGAGYVIAADERSGSIMEITLQRTDARGVRVAGPIAFTPSDGRDSIWPSVSFSGVQYGVTWLDDRTAVRRAYFARADGNLQPVPGSERPLSSATMAASAARVAWSAALGEWGLVWADSELHFERLSPAGVSLGRQDLGPGYLSDNGNPFIATPTGWAMVTSGTPPRVIELGTGAPVITTLPGMARRASIAFGGGQLAVTSDGNGRVQFLRVQGSVVVANSIIGLGTTGAYPPSLPSLGFNGQDFIAVWSETYSGSPSPLKFARLSPSATTANIAGSVLTTKTNAGFNSLSVGSCGFAITYGVFSTTADTLEVHP